MKTIIKLVIILLSLNSFAQVAPLEDYTWYFEKLIIEGDTTNDPTPNQELDYILMNFTGGNVLETHACNSLGANVGYTGNSFYINGYSLTLGGCQISVNQDFEKEYFQDFFLLNETPI